MGNELLDELWSIVRARTETAQPETARPAPVTSGRRRAGRYVLVAAATACAIVIGVLTTRSITSNRQVEVRTGSAPSMPTPTAGRDDFFVFGADGEELFSEDPSDPEFNAPIEASDEAVDSTYLRLRDVGDRPSSMQIERQNGPHPPALDLERNRIGNRDVQISQLSSEFGIGIELLDAVVAFYWTEADGTAWRATGYRNDLSRALPDIDYREGEQVLGASLARSEPPPRQRRPLEVLRSAEYRLEVFDDATTNVSINDPLLGGTRQVSIGDREGVITANGELMWRYDERTVMTITSRQTEYDMISIDEEGQSAAAATVRRADGAAKQAVRPWRGTTEELLIIKVAATDPLKFDESLVDEDEIWAFGYPETLGDAKVVAFDPDLGYSVTFEGISSSIWHRYGYAPKIGPEYYGRTLRLRFDPAVRPPARGPEDFSDGPCVAEVTVPLPGQPPVEVNLTSC